MMADGTETELLRLISRALNDELPPEQLARLEALLRNDPAARRDYYEFVKLHGHLSWTYGKVGGREPLAEKPAPVPLAAVPIDAVAPPASPAAAPTTSPVLGFLGGVMDSVLRSPTLMFCVLCGVLGVYCIMHFAGPMFGRVQQQQVAQAADDHRVADQKAGQQPNELAVHPAPVGNVVARLTNAVDCQWKLADSQVPSPRPSPIRGEGAGASGPQPSALGLPPPAAGLQPPAVGAEFAAGEKLNLTAGLAELTFESGAIVILHGPAQFVLTDRLGGDLQAGRVMARVPHSANRFAVNTPGGKVVDLGTEFGVKVNDDRSAEVIVYVGEVQIEPNASGAAGAAVFVSAGQAFSFAPGKAVAPIPVEGEHFVRDLASLADKSKAEVGYVALMKSLKPAVWLRMEGKPTDRVLHDEMGAADDALLSRKKGGDPFVEGRFGSALWLRGPKFKDYAIISDYPKAEQGRLSVVAWVYADSRPNFATIAKNWRYANDGMGQFHFGLVSEFDPKHQGGHPDSVDLGVELAQADGTTVSVREGPSHEFPLHAWQHVAFVTDGTTLRLFREGREVAATRLVGLRHPVSLAPLGIGVKPNNQGTAPDPAFPGYWNGRIDELAIFNDALSAEQIAQLAAAPGN